METHQTIMLGAFVRENPLLAAIAGTVLLALVVLLAGAVISHLFDRRRHASVRHEPVFDEGDPVDWSRTEPSGAEHAIGTVQAAASPRARRTGFGFGAVMVAFLVGLVAGGAGIAVSSQSVATAVASLVELVEPGPPAVGDGLQASDGVTADDSPASAIGPQPGDSPPVEIATPPEVSAKLATFADRLKASLPRAAGPELSLTRVDLDGLRLSLGYAVGRVMAEDETKAFDAYIMRTVKSLFCGRESREIRFLSENGVVFDMEYTDPDGATITRLTVEPGFCA
jgi:hypothetical protein